MRDEHATLVELATRGDEPALDALLQQHLPGLRAFVRLRCSRAFRDKESCSDITQSVCREVLERLDRFEYRGVAAFRAWLYSKALSKIQDRARYWAAQKRDVVREQRQQSESSGDYRDCYRSLLTPSRIAMGKEALQRIEQAFDQLPDDYREVITLSRIAGLTYAEIAHQTGRSEGSVKGLVERALNRLAWILSREDERES